MFTVSVTRLHLRSLRSIVPFALATRAISRQVQRSAGFIAGQLALELPYGFWTVTVWVEREAMLRFRNVSPHGPAMPRLLTWCSESSFVYWEQAGPELPTLEAAHEKLRSQGRVSKVNHPTPAHVAGRTVGDRKPRPGLPLRAVEDR